MKVVYRAPGLPGGGPWRILNDCEAPTHNTLYSRRVYDGRPRCICPRAISRAKRRRALESQSERDRRVEERKKIAEGHKQAWTGNADVRIPHLRPEEISRAGDFTGGLCTTSRGRKDAYAGMNDNATLKGIADRKLAKDLCERCPIKPECQEYVRKNESPPGSWGGVYAGMDPWNRRGQRLVFLDGKAAVVKWAGEGVS